MELHCCSWRNFEKIVWIKLIANVKMTPSDFPSLLALIEKPMPDTCNILTSLNWIAKVLKAYFVFKLENHIFDSNMALAWSVGKWLLSYRLTVEISNFSISKGHDCMHWSKQFSTMCRIFQIYQMSSIFILLSSNVYAFSFEIVVIFSRAMFNRQFCSNVSPSK